MTLERAIEILEAYNKYRKKGSLKCPYSDEITEAIDTVVKFHKKWNDEI
jgi:hypothetical protein